MSTKTELERMSFPDAPAWDRWLAKHHARSRGIWMVIAKKGATARTVDYPAALEVALTWGWIDGQKGRLDDEAWLQKFCPRGPRSIWSKVNRDKIAALEKAGRMKEPGRAAVRAAQEDGRWERAYDSPANAKVPDDLAAALGKSAKARRAFEALDRTNRYAILHRVHTAKLPATRARRIATFVAMLARGETLYPPRRPK